MTPPVPKDLISSATDVEIMETSGYKRSDIRYYARDHLESRKPYKKIKPALKFVYKRFSEVRHYPDRQKDWIPFAIRFASNLLDSQRIDALLTSSPPATTHIIAQKLKQKYNIPWVADFRDLWTQNHNYPYSRLRKFFERRLELKTLSSADALVGTSGPMANRLTTLHGKKEVCVITNGLTLKRWARKKWS